MNNKYIRALPVLSLAVCIVFTGCAGANEVTSTVQTISQSATGIPTPSPAPATATTQSASATTPSDSLTTQAVSTTTPDSSLPTVEDNPTIVIGVDGIFYPMTLVVSAGTKVDFQNEDCCNFHKLWSDAPFMMNMDPLALIPFNFDKAGTYKFWLDGVQWVYGTITVT